MCARLTEQIRWKVEICKFIIEKFTSHVRNLWDDKVLDKFLICKIFVQPSCAKLSVGKWKIYFLHESWSETFATLYIFRRFQAGSHILIQSCEKMFYHSNPTIQAREGRFILLIQCIFHICAHNSSNIFCCKFNFCHTKETLWFDNPKICSAVCTRIDWQSCTRLIDFSNSEILWNESIV